MRTLPNNIADLINADKELSFIPKWDSDDKDRHFEMLVPLTIDEVTIGGFSLRLRVSKEVLDRDAMAQIEYGTTRRTSEALWRMDWRPFHSHNNKGNGPTGLEWAEFDRVSHEHSFTDNFLPQTLVMRKWNLPRVRGIHPDPKSLSDFLDFSGKCFRIKNISSISLPVATIDLFWTPNGK